jgi:hypothetical protein
MKINIINVKMFHNKLCPQIIFHNLFLYFRLYPRKFAFDCPLSEFEYNYFFFFDICKYTFEWDGVQ